MSCNGEISSYQICNNFFNLALYYLYIFGGTLQCDLVLALGELNVHLLIKSITGLVHPKFHHLLTLMSIQTHKDFCSSS